VNLPVACAGAAAWGQEIGWNVAEDCAVEVGEGEGIQRSDKKQGIDGGKSHDRSFPFLVFSCLRQEQWLCGEETVGLLDGAAEGG
jgi:hypothetical protein